MLSLLAFAQETGKPVYLSQSAFSLFHRRYQCIYFTYVQTYTQRCIYTGVGAFCVLAITATPSVSVSSPVNPLPLRLGVPGATRGLSTSSDVAT